MGVGWISLRRYEKQLGSWTILKKSSRKFQKISILIKWIIPKYSIQKRTAQKINPIRKGKQETSNIENNSLDNPFNSSDISLPPIPGITIIATALSILSSQNHTGLTICNYAHASFNNRTNTHKHKHLSSGKNGGKLRRDLAGEGEPMEESGLRLLGSLAGPLFTPCSRVATNTASSFQQSSVIVTIDLDRNAHFLFAWPPAELG